MQTHRGNNVAEILSTCLNKDETRDTVKAKEIDRSLSAYKHIRCTIV